MTTKKAKAKSVLISEMHYGIDIEEKYIRIYRKNSEFKIAVGDNTSCVELGIPYLIADEIGLFITSYNGSVACKFYGVNFNNGDHIRLHIDKESLLIAIFENLEQNKEISISIPESEYEGIIRFLTSEINMADL